VTRRDLTGVSGKIPYSPFVRYSGDGSVMVPSYPLAESTEKVPKVFQIEQFHGCFCNNLISLILIVRDATQKQCSRSVAQGAATVGCSRHVAYASNCTRTAAPMPQGCKRFSKRMPLNDKFLKHLPDCPECKAVFAYLYWDATILAWIHRHRN
jgi:hypothetical protein